MTGLDDEPPDAASRPASELAGDQLLDAEIAQTSKLATSQRVPEKGTVAAVDLTRKRQEVAQRRILFWAVVILVAAGFASSSAIVWGLLIQDTVHTQPNGHGCLVLRVRSADYRALGHNHSKSFSTGLRRAAFVSSVRPPCPDLDPTTRSPVSEIEPGLRRWDARRSRQQCSSGAAGPRSSPAPIRGCSAGVPRRLPGNRRLRNQ